MFRFLSILDPFLGSFWDPCGDLFGPLQAIQGTLGPPWAPTWSAKVLFELPDAYIYPPSDHLAAIVNHLGASFDLLGVHV